MSDRAILFLFSIFMVVASLGAAGWLIASGQAGTVDGLFLLLTCLLLALAFALYVAFLIKRAMQAQQAPAAPAKAAAKAQSSTATKAAPVES